MPAAALPAAAVPATIPPDMIRELVQSQMSERGWNLLDLQKASGVPYSRIHSWLGPKGDEARGPSVQNLERIFTALDISVVPPKPRRKK